MYIQYLEITLRAIFNEITKKVKTSIQLSSGRMIFNNLGIFRTHLISVNSKQVVGPRNTLK